ncbi:hypothetical protein SAMD00020551_2932 [Mesobacillus selenatarsenatis SF-1]|uniref:Uncharacterized protein n=1 Tax=Mesobacillus selenatarsenatis (strain DSM 18680 / JCM 14380 / FERM P-15431 / SF-1) TaxID=1321606 RepID=A0A0A8X4A8_MESS1|nr:hypothetical protein SAMD00020551_2932 [Mesobacillus selenatarsenatis SF-1]
MKNFIGDFHNFIGDFFILLAILNFYWRKSPTYWRKSKYIGELEIQPVFSQLEILPPRTSLQ